VNGFTRKDAKGSLVKVPAKVLNLPPNSSTCTWGMLRSYVQQEAHLSNHQDITVANCTCKEMKVGVKKICSLQRMESFRENSMLM